MTDALMSIKTQQDLSCKRLMPKQKSHERHNIKIILHVKKTIRVKKWVLAMFLDVGSLCQIP